LFLVSIWPGPLIRDLHQRLRHAAIVARKRVLAAKRSEQCRARKD